jgi:ATP-dependent RNA helicase RhlE
MSAGVIQLSGTTNVVLDEADQMLDLGFVPAIRKILARVPNKRQTVLLSATMPKQIRKLAQDFLRRPTEVAVAPVARPIEKIDQSVMHVDTMDKRRVLVDLLKGASVERTIIFTRTKRGADKVTTHLEKNGISASAIHGNKSQRDRERTLAGFRNGRINVLVATDIAARGIDVDDISHVVNYDLPHVPESYVHRIGRTARAGKSGVAIAFCDRTEQPLLRDIERLVGYALKTIPGPQSERSNVRLPETRSTPRDAQKPNRRRPAQTRKTRQSVPVLKTQEVRAAAPAKIDAADPAPMVRKKRQKRSKAKAQAANVNTSAKADAAGLPRAVGKIGVNDSGENYLRR